MSSQQTVELKKHVAIIHCANKLSLVQRKLSNALLYHAYNDLLTKEKHKITIKELSLLIGYNSNDCEGLKKAIKTLLSTVLEWNLLGTDKNQKAEESKGAQQASWHASSILASASIKDGVCSYSYSHELRSLLYMPEVYGRINLLIQSRFSSSYALALYENCIRYRNLSSTGWFTLETFRKLMGVSAEKYKEFKNFKKRVLNKAVEEVNALSDICVIPEFKKVGNCIEAIKFGLSKNDTVKKTPPCVCETNIDRKSQEERRVDNGDSSDIEKILRDEFNLSIKQINKLLGEYSTNYIVDKIKLVQGSDRYKKKQINNIAAYFLVAIKDDFKSLEQGKKQSERTIQEEYRCRSEKKRREEEELSKKKAYQEYLFSAIEQAKANLSEKEKQEIEISFRDKIHSANMPFLIEEYKNSGYASKIIRAMHNSFILENYPNLIGAMTFEVFLSKEKS